MSFEEIYKKRGLKYKPYSPQQIPSSQDAFAQIKARQVAKQKLKKFEGMFEQGAELHRKAVEAANWKNIIRETAKGIPDAFPKTLKTLTTFGGVKAIGRGSLKGYSLKWLDPKTPEDANEIEKSIEAGFEIAGHLGAFMTGEAALKLAFKTPVIAAKLGDLAPKIAYVASWMGTTQAHKDLQGASSEERAKQATIDAALIITFGGLGYGFKKGIKGIGKGLTKYKYQIVSNKTIKGAFWKIFEDLPRQLEKAKYSKEAAKIIRGLNQSKVKTVDEGIKLIRKSLSPEILKKPGVEYSILNFQQHANNQINGALKDIFTKSLPTATAIPIVKLAEKLKPTKFKPGLKSIEKPIDFKITPEAEIKTLKSIQKEFPGIKSINEQIESLEKGVKPEELIKKGIIQENEYRAWLSKQPEVLKQVKKFTEIAETIKDPKAKAKYLKDAKHKLDTEFAKKYGEAMKEIKPVTKAKPLTKPVAKVKPTAQDYSKWVKKQPEAMKEFKDIQTKIAKIEDAIVKRTFIKKEQFKFETKYSKKFYKVFPKMKLAKPKTTIEKTRALVFNPKNLLNIKTKIFKKETDKLIKRSEISKMLSEKLNVPIRRGKFKGKALGIYKPSSKTVRIKKGNIPVISHEVGHFLDDTLGLSKTINKEEMIKLTAEYAQKPLLRMTIENKNKEALAEFIRYYITDPLKAKKEAPIYSSYFEKVMEKFPEIKDVLLVARQDYKRWTEMPSAAKVLSQVSFEKEKKGIKEKFFKNVEKFYIDIKDDLYPLKIFSNLARKFVPGVSNDELPYMLARIIRGRLGTANTFLEKGTFDKTFWTEPGKKFKFDFTGKGLGEILKPISKKGIMNEFNIFLVSLRVLELSKRNILTGIEKKDALISLKELWTKYPEFKNVSKEVYKFQDDVLKYGWQSGLFSSDLLTNIKSRNKFFVPFYRVIEELESGGYFGKGYVNVSNTLQRIKGSELDIINPLESIVKNTYAIINASERNTVGLAMANLAGKHYELGRMFGKISTPMAKVATVKKSDLSKGLLTDFEKMGFQTKEVEGIIDIFRPSLFLPKENVLTVLVKGKKHYFQVDPMLYKSLMSLDRTHTGIVIKLLSQPTRWLRAGAILTPEFMLRNPIRDLFGAFVFSKYGFYTPIDFIKGMFSLLQKDDYYWAWRASGGEHSMFVSMDREYLQKNIKEIIHGKGFKDYFKNPLEMLRVFSEFSEIPTRLGEFRKGIAKGVSPLEASYASREITLDFAKMGTAGKSINNLVVFWNAWAEGWDKLIRTFKHHPTRTTTRVITGITMPSILLYMVNRKDPRWKEIPQWRKDLFWIFFTEKRPYYLIKPFQLGILFGTIPERILEHLDTKDPEMMDRLAQNIFSSQTPGVQITFLEPFVENWANYDFFLDKPIISTSKTELPAEAQYTAYTSETAKMLGKTINYSPAKLENLFRGYFGGLGQHFINASDKILIDTGISSVVKPEPVLADKMIFKAFVMRRPIGNASASVGKFYDKYKKYESRERLLKQYITLGEKEKYYAYKAKYPELYFSYDYKRNVYFSIPARYYRKVAAQISELRKKEAQVYASKTLNALEKREKITEIDILITKYAKKALEFDIKK